MLPKIDEAESRHYAITETACRPSAECKYCADGARRIIETFKDPATGSQPNYRFYHMDRDGFVLCQDQTVPPYGKWGDNGYGR